MFFPEDGSFVFLLYGGGENSRDERLSRDHGIGPVSQKLRVKRSKKKNLVWPNVHTVSCSWKTLFHFCSVTFPAAKRPKGSSSSPAQWNRLRLRSDWQTANTPPTETRGKPTQGIFQLKWDRRTKKSTRFRFHATSTVVQHYRQAGRNCIRIISSNHAKIFKERYCSRVCWAALSATSQRRQTLPQLVDTFFRVTRSRSHLKTNIIWKTKTLLPWKPHSW